MNATVLIQKLLGAHVMTKSRVGFLVALVAFFTIVGEAALTSIDLLSRNDTFVCAGVGLLGFLGWLTGRVREARRVDLLPVQDTPAEEAAAEHPLALFGSLKGWGVILVLLAGTLSFLVAWRRHKPVLIVHARPLPVATITMTNLVTRVITITNEAPRLVFPSLELEGVVVNGAISSAPIRRVLRLGEALSNAVLVAVDSEHAFMAMEGQTNARALRK
jgi:hypothetical protein